MTDKNLNDLHPNLEPLCKQFLEECKEKGLKVVITETWRSPAREDQLHAQGITKATGLTCKHCFEIDGKPASKAFDFILFDENNRIINDGADDCYSLAGHIAEGLGLHWGGRFSRPDWDHVEIA
jgi:peptidoglycan L-alanyl-D-glutamate endopeptidase CwlK